MSHALGYQLSFTPSFSHHVPLNLFTAMSSQSAISTPTSL